MFEPWQGPRIAWLRATQWKRQLDFAKSTCKILKLSNAKFGMILKTKRCMMKCLKVLGR
jgi:hypothetical protein